MRIRKRMLCGFLVLWPISVVVYLASTPALTSGKEISSDFSGRYVCSKKDGKGDARIGYPFVAFDMVKDGATINVRQDSTRSITFEYQWTNGFWKTNAFYLSEAGNISWNDGCLTYFKRNVKICGILPGVGVIVDASRVRRNHDGDLEIHYSQTQKALALFVFPFSETLQSKLILKCCRSNQ